MSRFPFANRRLSLVVVAILTFSACDTPQPISAPDITLLHVQLDIEFQDRASDISVEIGVPADSTVLDVLKIAADEQDFDGHG